MSDLSLLTGVYADVEAYGALIDRVIERLGRGEADPTDPDQRKLAQLLVDASAQGLESQSIEALMLDSLLRTNTGEPLANLKRLGERLQSGDVDPNISKTTRKTRSRAWSRNEWEVARRPTRALMIEKYLIWVN